MDRRRFLASAAAVGTATLAGCTGSGGTGSGGTGNGTASEEHAATTNLDSQPIRGGGEALIVAFEDPSCTICRRFERDTYPELQSKLLDTGTARFAYRGLPIIYPWGDPASHVLEATYDADAEAFWALKDHYYAQQGAFDSDNVYDLSEQFLGRETGVDAAAVVTAAKTGAADTAVQLDLDAGEQLGIGQTPVFYLFRDGEFLTELRGAQGYSVFETALGV
ncbi:DsbA family protein [Halorarius litoreus]|uniref:DsbA family protein n=1 Tax=Halorarius litoreus TaxID=2962676 RepID=UPI0020CE7C78|nr:thioredoxin domain-containing protein [Halorarius litoreus]